MVETKKLGMSSEDQLRKAKEDNNRFETIELKKLLKKLKKYFYVDAKACLLILRQRRKSNSDGVDIIV